MRKTHLPEIRASNRFQAYLLVIVLGISLFIGALSGVEVAQAYGPPLAQEVQGSVSSYMTASGIASSLGLFFARQLSVPEMQPLLYLPFVLNSGPPRLQISGDWTQFRHDAQHTAATNREMLSISPKSATQPWRWRVQFRAWPHVHAEPVVANESVYIANTDGVLTSLNDESGAVRWVYDTGAPILTTPAVIEGRIHVVNVKGRLVTLDTSGRLLWEYTVPGDVYASPMASSGRIFFGTVAGTFYAFDSIRGGEGPLWSFPVGAMIDTSAVEIGGRVIFAAENMTAYALRASDGAPLWFAQLPGARTWNGHPVASVIANAVYFSVITEFREETSTHREVIGMKEFEDRKGPLNEVAQYADGFIGRNRLALQPAVVLDAASGAPVKSFRVAPTNAIIGGLPFNSWYWGSIRPALWQGDKLYLQSMQRNILVNLSSNNIYQPNPDQRQTGHFVRGDEQVPVSIGGNRVYGGIGSNIAYLDLTTGTRGNLWGEQGNEQRDATPLTEPLEPDYDQRYLTMPGDGYTDPIGVFIVANERAYYIQYGTLYCFDGTVVTR